VAKDLTLPAHDYFEFGPFRLDSSSRSLYRGDEFVPVTPKAFDTLCLLVEEAGRVVTKDELLQRVWPDTFVEEGSIANNISILRKILNPHFEGDGPIATVARRGYRFTAPVQLRNARAEIALVAEPGTPAQPVGPVGIAERAAWRSSARLWPLVAAASVLAAVIAAVIAVRLMSAGARADAPRTRRAIAVLAMKNVSGRGEYAWFSTALSEAINTDLGAGGQLRLISGAAVAEIQQDIAPQAGLGLTRKQLDEIGSDLGCDLVLTGDYTSAGGRIRVDMQLDDIKTGATVATVSVSDDEKKLLDLVASASRELRAKLGLGPALAGAGAAARAALSANPDALRFYFLGLEALRNHDVVRSIELLAQATEADPDFALAHSVMSISWRVLGYDSKSQDEATRAFQLSSRLGREDRLGVEGAYYEVMSDWPKAIEQYQSLWSFYPDNIAYALKLVHQQLLGGRLQDAGRVIAQMKALPPPADGDPRVDVVESDWLYRQGRYADAAAVAAKGVEKAARRKSNQLRARLTLVQGRALMHLGDLDEATRLIAAAKRLFDVAGDPGGASDAIRSDALALLARDQPDAAARRIDEALRMAKAINNQRLVPDILIERSTILCRLGKLSLAKEDAETALAAVASAQGRARNARALIALGKAEKEQRDYTASRKHLEDAERIGRDVGEPPVFTDAANTLAGLDLLEGRVDDAQRRVEEIAPIDRRTGDKAAIAADAETLAAIAKARNAIDKSARDRGPR